jgi:predicted dehydrogenase
MSDSTLQRPRIGALGVGWIGRHRMERVVDSGAADVVALCDPNVEAIAEARAVVGQADIVASLDEMLELDLDAVMIATPSAMHAEQAIQALSAGKAVFCQKPLARTAEETRRVVAAAREVDRLVGVDFSYRHTEAMQHIRRLVEEGRLGDIYAVDLVFHNAYGPDKEWFYDVGRAGGGCLIDLGIHLVDLALWALDWPEIEAVQGRCLAAGRPLAPQEPTVEDYATAIVDLGEAGVVDLACSWRLAAGRDAVIEAAFYGTEGGARMRNVDGSFYDFVAERYVGTRTELLCEPPDAWGGRAAVAWAEQLAACEHYDDDIERVVQVAQVVDRVYGR